LFKLVYDEQKDKAWAYWQENSDETKASPPISYAELVERTGISFLPSLNDTKATAARQPGSHKFFIYGQ